jgi:hypothetical protein
MKVSIYNITSIRMNIKINTPNINAILTYPNKENNNTIYYCDQYLYNENFKIVKCKKLIINNSTNDVMKYYNFGYNNLPLSLTTLIIEGYVLTDNFK